MTLKIREWLILLWSGEGENNKEEDPNMRNLKKILALVLALMMVLSVMVFASAANLEDYADSEQVSEEYAEAVDVLSGMGILKGSEGKVYPQSYVKRAEVSTLIYRMVTGDVGDTLVYLHKNYDKFEDVKETNWFAGFVNYAANNELVKGVGDNKFNPEGYMTGYELITILLRAIGYDRNNEISGSEWKITAATLAQDVGILDGLTDTTLGDYLTREEIVHLIFNALQVKQVLYTGVNYYPYFDSIGEENFGLDSRAGADTWGRPGVEWYDSRLAANNVYAFIEEEPIITYDEAVTECDVADDTTDRDTNYALYVNGQSLGNYTVNAADTVTKIGAQGRLTEVYSDRIVMVDTFLAQVTDVKAATYDKNNHLATPATITLTVYDAINGRTAGYVLTNGATNWNYTVGQMVLLNAYTDPTNSATVSGKVDNTNTGKYGEIYGVAESLVGAQSTIWNRVDRHTVNGEDYYDAVKFYLDQAGTDTTNHTWYFDQYDNLIGVTDIISGNYAVLKDIRWVVGTPGHAEATLIDLAGNESTVTVDTLDGFYFGGSTWTQTDDDAEPSYRAGTTGVIAGGTAYVSDDTIHNGHYYGYAMYRVDTNMDGTVSLEGAEWTAAGVETTIVNYVDNATLRTGSSTVMDGNSIVVHINNATQFLVLNGDDSFSAYEGTNALPLFVDDTVDLFYKDVNGDAIADYVYVKDAAVAADFGSLLYVVEDDYTGPLTDGATTIYRLNVVVDGVERTVTTNNAALAEYLSDNVGKVFYATFDETATSGTYGYLTNAQLVNFATDGAIGATGYSVDYLASDNIYRVDDTLVDYYAANNNVGYRVTDSTPVVGGTLSGDLDDYGIWVVYTTVGGEKIASLVYVGTKLDQDSSPVVSGKYEDADGDDVILSAVANSAETVYTVTLPEGETSADVRVTGTHFNAVVSIDNTTWAPVWSEPKGVDSKRPDITVMAEDGYHTETFTVAVDGTAASVITDAVISIQNGAKNAQFAEDLEMYFNYEDALKNAATLKTENYASVILFVDGHKVCADTGMAAGYAAKIWKFTDSSNAPKTDFDVYATTLNMTAMGESSQIQISGTDVNSIFVVQFIQQGTGTPVYFAFQIDSTT